MEPSHDLLGGGESLNLKEFLLQILWSMGTYENILRENISFFGGGQIGELPLFPLFIVELGARYIFTE